MSKHKTKVKVDNIMSAILSEIDDFATLVQVDTQKVLKETAEETAKRTAKAWKESGAPSAQTSSYGDTFDYEVVEKKTGRITYHVGNTDYRVAHLLEHGHALVRGGRSIGEGKVKDYPHFKIGEQYAEDAIAKNLQKAIEEIK